jgi:hypothetical protein
MVAPTPGLEPTPVASLHEKSAVFACNVPISVFEIRCKSFRKRISPHYNPTIDNGQMFI